MALVLSEDQTLIQDTARDFCQTHAPISQLRALRDSGSTLRHDPDTWQRMVDLGWPGIALPEAVGGTDFGFTGLGLILEQCGRTLAASPLFSTAVLGGSAILLGGTDAQRQALLPALVDGSRRFTLAVDEGPHHDPAGVALTASRSGDGFRLSGQKCGVIDGGSADTFIVVARTAGAPGDQHGLTLFIVPADAAGLTVTPLTRLDSRDAADLSLQAVEVAADAVLGSVDDGAGLLRQVLDRARIGAAAEMLGLLQEAFDRTLEYLKERKQFGVVIGAFQGLKHRIADLFCEVELCRSVVLDALAAVDAGDDETIAASASLAKARLGDTLNRMSNEAIQMHGGIGMTDEFDIGFFIKRARALEHAFGSSRYHRDRFAALAGF